MIAYALQRIVLFAATLIIASMMARAVLAQDLRQQAARVRRTVLHNRNRRREIGR